MSKSSAKSQLKTLVVVESPAKAKTINKYLGNNYIVKSSIGHIKDLPNYSLGIDLDNNFQPKYEVIKGKAKVIKELKDIAKESGDVLIATDPDREGEAIAYHLADEITPVNNKIKRVIFNEITKSGINKGITSARDIDHNLFMSQQARRVMDRIIGFQVSPFLSNKMIGKTSEALSAGRVQSVALRLICEREREILGFESIEYWNIFADFKCPSISKLPTLLVAFENKLIQKPSGSAKGNTPEETKKIKNQISKLHFIKNKEQADNLLAQIKQIQEYEITKKQTKDVVRRPNAPFTTSTLQQEAAKQLGFTNKKTMQIAQKLYEGVNIGNDELVGLITYMRTDSVRVSDDAIKSVREYVSTNYGENYLPKTPNTYESKSKNMQDAHEAIRPTNVQYDLKELKKSLTKDEMALYQLIYFRFVASQMSNAILEQTVVEISSNGFIFRATGSVVKFDGYMKIYTEAEDEKDENATNDDEDKEIILPKGIEVGKKLSLTSATSKQAGTKPPARFTQASLIKILDELGIGRPSTYATIVSTLSDRKYVELEKKSFRPTQLGFDVNDILVASFDSIFNVNFTSKMEEELDEIAEGDKTYLQTVNEFYEPFSKTLNDAQTDPTTNSETICPECGGTLTIKVSRKGRFLGCSNYPTCKFTKPLPKNNEEKEKKQPEIYPGAVCPICGKPMYLREGRYGKFLGCVDYPNCKGILPLTSNVKCPKCNEGHLVERYSPKTKKKFWSCSNYPKCDYLTNYEPINHACPNCNNPYLEYHFRKNSEGEWDKFIKCPECKTEFDNSILEK